MTELRIRSEAFEEVWAQPFLPPQAHAPGLYDDGDDGDFGPLLLACQRALTPLFGLPVTVVPGRPPKAEAGAPVPPVAAILASLLATLQLGGDPARLAAGGQAARQARQIAEALQAAADTSGLSCRAAPVSTLRSAVPDTAAMPVWRRRRARRCRRRSRWRGWRRGCWRCRCGCASNWPAS